MSKKYLHPIFRKQSILSAICRIKKNNSGIYEVFIMESKFALALFFIFAFAVAAFAQNPPPTRG